MSILSAALGAGPPPPTPLEGALRVAEMIAFDLNKSQAETAKANAEIAKLRESDRALAERIADLQRQLETVRSERAELQISLAKAQSEKTELPSVEVLELAARRLKKQLAANERLVALARKWGQDTHKAILCAEIEQVAAELLEQPAAVNGGKS